MLKFSLVIATYGRTTELETLLESVFAQAYPDVQCIVVDQNTHDGVQQIINQWKHRLDITRVTCEPGLSRARNYGLKFVTGDIVAFPDDDCWYTSDLLADVSEWFDLYSEFDVFTVGAVDHQGRPSGNRWVQKSCEITPLNAFRTTFSSTIFVRRNIGQVRVKFDEALGVGAGTEFCCGEETDYVFQLFQGGRRGYFDSTLAIGHPKRDMLSGTVNGARATGYGRGMGYVLAKHGLPHLSAAFVAYDMVRAALSAARGNFSAASLCFKHGSGIASGYRRYLVSKRKASLRPSVVQPKPMRDSSIRISAIRRAEPSAKRLVS